MSRSKGSIGLVATINGTPSEELISFLAIVHATQPSS